MCPGVELVSRSTLCEPVKGEAIYDRDEGVRQSQLFYSSITSWCKVDRPSIGLN